MLVVGRGGDNVKRWIDLGFIDIQPSEYAKLTLIIILARLLSEKEGQLGKRFSASIPPALIYTAVLTALIFLQPDLARRWSSWPSFWVVVRGRINLKYLFYMLGSGGQSRFLSCGCSSKVTRKKRLMIFLNPEMDPLGYGYQLMQSIIAVGSGSIWGGKGLFEGTQVRLNYLPEQHTDFIFAVLGEELGFIGGCGPSVPVFFC